MAERARFYATTLFFVGPTFFANMLRAGLPADALAGVRLAASAGEAFLPPRNDRRFCGFLSQQVRMAARAGRATQRAAPTPPGSPA
jgi:hypothetical protein